MEQAIANLLTLLEQGHALLTEVQTERGALLAQVGTLTAERDAARLQASNLNAASATLQQRLDALVPAGGGVPVPEFKRRLAPMYARLGFADDSVQRRWDRVLGLISGYTTIYPAEAPVSDLIAAAVGEGLLTAAEAAALAAPVGG